ncbi:hypothetical protein ET495_10970 [Xylanimonas allomyrinae]|uniref:RAMA domain-containing protein n=1 Tax=Xylanimonas allomyrinae TaxID=2509459 RepID=A0A4P6ELY9_9MICO|nr:hypothetical protein ET495_10970 [Xylanimonas allomyrinae]
MTPQHVPQPVPPRVSRATIHRRPPLAFAGGPEPRAEATSATTATAITTSGLAQGPAADLVPPALAHHAPGAAWSPTPRRRRTPTAPDSSRVLSSWSPADAWDPDSGEDPVPAVAEPVAIAFGEVFSAASGTSRPAGPALPGAPARAEAPFEPPRLNDGPAPEPWWLPTAGGSRAWDAPSPPIVLDEAEDADLAALAERLGAATTLVWERPRRGQRFVATLHPDGSIELPDGSRYRHPDVAASAASGAYTAEGWSVWRVGGSAGRTLTEEFRARFA